MGDELVRCAVLGKAEIGVPGIRLTPESERQYGLALFFCANGGRAVPRDEVAQLFWPEHGLEAARHCLRQTLYRLRALGVPVRSGAKTITLDEACIETDYAAAVAEGATSSVFLELTDVTVLPGYGPRFSEPFAEWVERFRGDLAARLRRGLVRGIAEARSRGRYTEVDRLARLCLTLDPLNEEATLALAEAVALVGGKAEAVGMIDRYVGEVGGHPDIRIPADILRARVSELPSGEHDSPWDHTVLVGREAEIEQLLTSFAHARYGRPQFVCLTGEAGVGKTALANHLLRLLGLRECSVVRVACQQLDKGRPLAVLAQVVSGLFKQRGALGAAAETLSILRALTNWETSNPREDEQGRQLQLSQIQGAFEDLVEALLHEAPLVLLVDDIHWIDPRSLAFLASIASGDQRRSLMLLACARPHLGKISAQLPQDIHMVRVHPLNMAESTALMHQLLAVGSEPILEEELRNYVSVAGGNPLFVIQLARHLLEAKSTELRPESLRALVRSRLHTLDVNGLLTLQACSCLGTYATLPRLERVLQLPSHQLLRSLALLEDAGMVRIDDGAVRCRHDVFAEVAKASTPPSVATLLHSRAARVMESDAKVSGDAMLLWQSAEHCQMACQSDDARRVLTKLGDYLIRIGMPSEAKHAFERAMSYCDSWEQQLALTDRVLHANRASRDWVAIIRTVEQRRQLQKTLTLPSDPLPTDQLLELEARTRLSADMRLELDLIMRQLNTESYDLGQQAALVLMGLIMADNLIDARAATQLISFLPGHDNSETYQDLLLSANLVYHTSFGSLDSALRYSNDIKSKYASISVPDMRSIQRLRWSATPLLYAGRFLDCERVLTRAVSDARRLFLWSEAGSAATLLADIGMYRSDLGYAERWLKEAHSYLSRSHDEELRTDLRGCSAVFALLNGDAEGARQQLANSVPHSNPRPERRVRARALSLKLAADHAGGHAPDEDIEELVSLSRGATGYGDFDFIMCVLLKFLSQRADESSRRNLLRDYLGERRERYPMPVAFLESFCPELSVICNKTFDENRPTHVRPSI